jgi:hypothetical protein
MSTLIIEAAVQDNTCLHNGLSSCNESCVCSCDYCTEQYELNWDAYTTEKSLCKNCGIPTLITLDTLAETRFTHFYSPCESCKKAYLEFMKLEGLCPQCQGPLSANLCPGCYCTEDVETCGCRQCLANRRQYVKEDLDD